MVRKKEVAILGCGPAGLMAAHAVAMNGDKPYIIAIRQQSKMFGAMYLHRPIYGITDLAPEGMIDIIKYGTSQGYAQKVYGMGHVPVSFDKFEEGKHPTWDLRKAYDLLWEKYGGDNIVDHRMTYEDVMAICRNFEIVFCTIPAPVICRNTNHRFPSRNIQVLHGQLPPTDDTHHNMMVYDGRRASLYYRYSVINNYAAWEYAGGVVPEVFRYWEGSQVSPGIKPLRNDCNCWEGWNLWKLGRFGRWEKGILTHHAYEEAERVLNPEFVAR